MEPPKEVNVGLVATVIGIIGVISGWIVSSLSAANKSGAKNEAMNQQMTGLTDDVAKLTLKVDELESDLDKKFAVTFEKFEKSVDKLYGLVYDPSNGAVRFLTHPEHDKMVINCQASMKKDIDNVIAGNRKDMEHLIADHKKDLDHIHEAVRRIETLVAK